jgi:zinc transporter ZupT
MHHQHHDDILDIHEHSHSHGHQNENGNKQQVNKLDYDNLTPSASTSSSAATVKSEDKNFRIEDISTVPIKKSTTKSGFLNLKQIQSTGWVAFIGDILHKAADGFAIGASFAESLSLGFSTSLAILFHEIPHELGDYAVLLGAGFKFWNILVLNTITSFTSWVAFMIISSVSPSVLIREYIFAVITGVFIYIALANMVTFTKLFKIKFGNLLVIIISFLIN